VGKYIVDFVCFEKKIIIELDGGQHAMLSEKQKDTERDKWFEAQGYKVLRFWDDEVLTNTWEVLELIRTNGFNHPPLNPLLYESSTIKGGVNNEEISYNRGKRNISTGKSEEHKNKQGKLIKK
jgi:hypothetical protein